LALLFWTQPRPATVSAVDTLEDALFLSLTVVVIVGMVGSLLAAWPQAGYLCLAGAVAGAMASLIVLFAGLPTPAQAGVMWQAGVALVAAVTIAAWMWRTLPGDLLADRRDKFLAAAFAAILPGIQVWHTIAFTEATQKVAISVTTSLENLGVDAASGAPKVRLSMLMENKGQTRALVLVSRASYCWVEDQGTVGEDLVAMGHQPNCGWTRPVAQASWLDAGTALSDSLALVAPADKTHLIVGVHIAYARGDRLQTEPVLHGPIPVPDNKPCVHASYLPIMAESRVKSMAHGQTYLMYADRNNDGGLNYWIASDTTCQPEGETAGREEYANHYAITETTAWFETWAQPTPAATK
jgi:hypothetical protein